MNRIILTPEEKTQLELSHRHCENRKEGDQFKAVLLRSEGWTIPQISQALRIQPAVVASHISDYQSGKFSSSKNISQVRLSQSQSQELVQHLEENIYQHKYEIARYVKEQWDVHFTLSDMHKWLCRYGFSYRKINNKRATPDPELQDEELQEPTVQDQPIEEKEAPKKEPVYFTTSVRRKRHRKIIYGWVKNDKTQ